MKPLTQLLTLELIEGLSTRSNLRAGKEIAREGGITPEKTNTFNLIAQVQFRGGETRTVELMSTSKGFRWKCTCSSRKTLFCKHCTAASIALIDGMIKI